VADFVFSKSGGMHLTGFSRGDSCAQIFEGFSDPLIPAELAGLSVFDDAIEIGESIGVLSKKLFQLVFQSRSPSIGVNANGPETGLLFDRLPKLLGNPKNVLAHEGAEGKPIGQDSETLAG